MDQCADSFWWKPCPNSKPSIIHILLHNLIGKSTLAILHASQYLLIAETRSVLVIDWRIDGAAKFQIPSHHSKSWRLNSFGMPSPKPRVSCQFKSFKHLLIDRSWLKGRMQFDIAAGSKYPGNLIHSWSYHLMRRACWWHGVFPFSCSFFEITMIFSFLW